MAPATNTSGIDFFRILPLELSLRICCYLDPRSLDSVSNVCRAARHLLQDEIAWKNAFLEAFGTTSEFSCLQQTWRLEYSSRSALLRRYGRGRGRSVVFDGKIGNITMLHWDTSCSRLTIANQRNGLASIADTLTGKVAKDILFPASVRLTSGDVTALSITRNHIIYGFTNGMIAMNSLNRHGQRTEFKTYHSWHTGSVTVICSSNPATSHAIGPNCISGGADGTIKLWDTTRARQCLATISVSDYEIVEMSWDFAKSQILVLTCRSELFSVQLSDTTNMSVQCLNPGVCSTTSWTSMICDHSGEVVIVATNSGVDGYSIGTLPAQTYKIQDDSRGQITRLAIDKHDPGPIGSLPGVNGRLAAFSDEHGVISIINTRNLTAQARYTRGAEVNVSAICLTSSVLAAGYHDGSVALWDILNLSTLRALASKISKYERIAEEDPARVAVHCIELQHNHPAGIIVTGGQVRSFDYDPRSDLPNGKRKGLARTRHTGHSMSAGGKLAMQDEIRDDIRDLENRQRVLDKEQQRVRKLAGGLAQDMTDEELVSYAELLSLEALDDTTQHHDSQPASGPRDDLEEAVYRSLQEVTQQDRGGTSTEHFPLETAGEIETNIGDYDADYALAIALSRSLS